MNFPINIMVGMQEETGDPVFYREGNFDSEVDTLPTGEAAANTADGSWAVDTNPASKGEVSQYNKRTDTWSVCFTLSSS